MLVSCGNTPGWWSRSKVFKTSQLHSGSGVDHFPFMAPIPFSLKFKLLAIVHLLAG